MSHLYRFSLRYRNQDEPNKRPEKGRTMLEMMAVLVIVGILSLLALVGYQIALKTWRINESVNEVKTAATAIKSGNFDLIKQQNCDEDGVCTDVGITTGTVSLKADTYINGVDINDDGINWKTTNGQQLSAQQEKTTDRNQIVLNLSLAESKNALEVDDCRLFVNPNIGYDYIEVNGVKCSAEEVRIGTKQGCRLADLCPPKA